MSQFSDPTKQLHVNGAGVTLTDGVANTVSNCIAFKIQKGLASVFPGVFQLVMKLYDNTTPDEMPADTEFAFAYKVPGRRRPIPLGVMTLYAPWRRISTADQADEDFKDSVVVSLGIPVLALREDESLILQVWASTGTLDASECEIYIPYAEGSPADVQGELKMRAAKYGV